VEFLDKQSFVKFKPNVVVRSQGSRGNDFTYHWITDQYGFKNKLSIEFETTTFDFIALGDSFTEGMGVRLVNTWASQVGGVSEYKIYNSGVQGYSASQMKATYEILQKEISHEGIIIGTLPTIYTGEAVFTNKSQNFSMGIGGILSIAAAGIGNSFFVQFLRAIKLRVSGIGNISNKGKLRLKQYVTEIPFKYSLSEELLTNQNWIAYNKHLVALAKTALERGKKVILMQYPQQHEVYFNIKELGVKNINEISYYVELNLLRKSLPKDVQVLDMFPYIKKYLATNKEYIYFKNDTHMNEKGNEIVAEFLVQNLK
jgi:hypothetical protein